MDFAQISKRLMKELDVHTDKAIAEAIGLSTSTFNSQKKRGAFPEAKLRAFAQSHPELNLDVDYILTGKRKAELSAEEPRATYGADEVRSDERMILRWYRAMSAQEQEVLLGMAATKSSPTKITEGQIQPQISLAQSNIGNGVVIQQLGKDK